VQTVLGAGVLEVVLDGCDVGDASAGRDVVAGLALARELLLQRHLGRQAILGPLRQR